MGSQQFRSSASARWKTKARGDGGSQQLRSSPFPHSTRTCRRECPDRRTAGGAGCAPAGSTRPSRRAGAARTARRRVAASRVRTAWWRRAVGETGEKALRPPSAAGCSAGRCDRGRERRRAAPRRGRAPPREEAGCLQPHRGRGSDYSSCTEEGRTGSSPQHSRSASRRTCRTWSTAPWSRGSPSSRRCRRRWPTAPRSASSSRRRRGREYDGSFPGRGG